MFDESPSDDDDDDAAARHGESGVPRKRAIQCARDEERVTASAAARVAARYAQQRHRTSWMLEALGVAVTGLETECNQAGSGRPRENKADAALGGQDQRL
jgi:hypothetical protein